jgi:hypothetical protein
MLIAMSSKLVVVIGFTSLLIALMLISQARAETDIPKPSVPEFIVTYADDIIPEDRAMEFSIKNQPFSQYTDENSSVISLYYNFRFSHHAENDWVYYPIGPNGNSTFQYYSFNQLLLVPPKVPASDSTYTNVSITLSILSALWRNAIEGEFDIQVQALIGHIDRIEISASNLPAIIYHFTGEASDWSNTQTLAIPYTPVATVSPSSSPFPSPSLSPSPTIAPTIEPTSEPSSTPKPASGFLGTHLPVEYGYAIVAVLVIIVVAGSLVYFKKIRK